MSSKDLIAQLLKAGWVLRGSKGSHHIFVHAHKPGHLSVPHPKKDLGLGLVKKLLKQAEKFTELGGFEIKQTPVESIESSVRIPQGTPEQTV